jgi:hypothetical protein
VSLNVLLILDTLIVERITIRFCKTLTFDKMMEEMQRPEAMLCILGDEVNAEDEKPYFISSRHELKNENDKQLKIRCYVSNDYKFYAKIQGKPNRAGSWCPYCSRELRGRRMEMIGGKMDM